jgi:lipid-binding SYLF domain-containing protein
MICREGTNFSGKWSPPAMYSIGGASAGLQVGGKASDIVIAVMAPTAAERVLSSKVKVGTDVSAAAGPGASAGSFGNSADMLTYSRSSGLFAGASIDGASLDPDSRANERLYGKPVSAKEIVSGGNVKATPAGESLVSLLNSKLSKHEASR